MLIKLLGVILVAAAGVIPAIRVGLKERRRLARTEAFFSLCRLALEQTAALGAAVPEILRRAEELCSACGAAEPDAAALVTAAEENLPTEGVRAVEQVFGSAAGTREEQVARCRAAVAVMESIYKKQSEEFRGKLRTGIVLPLSAAAIALLLLW